MNMTKKIKFLFFLMLITVLSIIFPLVAFYSGDDLIMDMAGYYIKNGDMSQAMTYYDRLEAFFPQSPRIFEERFYRAGLLIQKDSYPGRMVFRFSGITDKIQKPGMASFLDSRAVMEPDSSENIQSALDTLNQLSKDLSEGGKKGWIERYIPWLEAKCFYELGDSDRAARILEGIDFDNPEASWPLTIWLRILLDRGKYDDVRKMVDEYANKSRQPGQGMMAELYDLKGDAFLAEGLTDEAMACYEKAKSFIPAQFSWLKEQKFMKIVRAELSQENLEKGLDEKIAQVMRIKTPSNQHGGEGVFGRITEDGRPVVGQKILIADPGDDINFSGRYPTVESCYSDIGGNFYFPHTPKNPVFGIGLPVEKARDSSLSVKKSKSAENSFYELSIVPVINAGAEVNDAGRGNQVSLFWDAVPGAKRYDIFLIPPEKKPEKIFVSSVNEVEVKEKALKIYWQIPQEELLALKPNPSPFEDIKPYNILGPLYPGAGSFIYIKAYNGDGNLLSDSMGFSTWDRILSKSSNEGSPAGPYVFCKNMDEGDTFVMKGLFLHAAERYEQEIAKRPDNKETLEKMARLYLWAPGVKDTGKAAEFLKMLRKRDDLRYKRLSAELLFQQGNVKGAEGLFEALMERGELDPAGYHILAGIYLQAGDYDGSIDSYRKVFEMSKEKLMDYSPITAACMKGDFEQAYALADEIVFDGQRFFDVLTKARSKKYSPDVMADFKKMLAYLIVPPSRDAEAAFEIAYKDFTKKYPRYQELSDTAFKLGFNRFK
ncbi:hypothetical protein D2962_12025 [Biomaibacter acetigenes]|uniref:Tetratricopeptide repeat protein n=2 Tax=Biomaibacter acetigenes TaxID=2316383 RepID=A0A3G2R754_9FIRM|nr:hypothetical protein D2962_12025 [Biomaibacter acetigenes]